MQRIHVHGCRWKAVLWLRIASLSILLLTSSVYLTAQSSTSLHGVVKDPSGAVVPSASVKLLNPETKYQRETVTDGLGEYQFQQIPPGHYQLTVTAEGFRVYEETGLEVLINTPATSNVKLAVGNKDQSVSVNAEAVTINTSDASMGTPFNETQIEELPLEGRNVVDLLSLQSGVVYTGNRPDQDVNNDTRSGAVNGARSDQSNVTLDGVDVNDQNSGYAFTSVLPVTLDSVQEFRVTTTNYNADQGGSSGAQVSLVTKSGSNHWHGSLYEYNRNTATSANDWFIKGAQAASGEPNTPPQLIRNIFGGSVGGPIIKDRLYFFTNLEFTRVREQNSVVRTVPSALLRQGTIQYLDVNGNITSLNAAQVTALDPLVL
jgi:Carboxypeptidase regulatory-like domain